MDLLRGEAVADRSGRGSRRGRGGARSGSVWAKISATSAKLPSEIHIFWPLIRQPPSIFSARVRIDEGSEPASGSVSPKQPRASPEHSRGSQRLLLLLGAPALDRAADERGLNRDDGPRRGVAAADLLDDQPVADVVEAPAAVLLGDRGAEVAHVPEPAGELAVEACVAVVVARPRDDLVVGEVARRLGDQALLVGEVEVHGGQPTSSPSASPEGALERLGGLLRPGPGHLEREAVDRRDRLDLAHGGGEERLVGAEQVVQRRTRPPRREAPR